MSRECCCAQGVCGERGLHRVLWRIGALRSPFAIINFLGASTAARLLRQLFAGIPVPCSRATQARQPFGASARLRRPVPLAPFLYRAGFNAQAL